MSCTQENRRQVPAIRFSTLAAYCTRPTPPSLSRPRPAPSLYPPLPPPPPAKHHALCRFCCHHTHTHCASADTSTFITHLVAHRTTPHSRTQDITQHTHHAGCVLLPGNEGIRCAPQCALANTEFCVGAWNTEFCFAKLLRFGAADG
jgi:hypothetical protein